MKTSSGLNPKISVLLVYLLYLLIITMKPFDFDAPYDIRYHLVENMSVLHFVLNVILFLPFGFLVFSLIGKAVSKDYTKILICAVSGVILSFGIETYQLFLNRSTELSDVLMNGIGAFAGAVIFKSYGSEIIGTVRFIWVKVRSSAPLLTLIIAFYSIVVFISLVFPIRYVDLSNWNPDFPFQIGNETTLDRPWVGTIYLAAVYNRALSDDEVYANFRAGHHPPEDGGRFKDGLIAFYGFGEGSGRTVHDRSGFETPLDLTIDDPSGVRWLPSGGLEILGNTVIKSERYAEKLYEWVKPAGEFTVEVWALPGNILQDGPARIVSFSKNTDLRNFTLGQSGADIDFRVRTPLSGLNGTDKYLTAENAISTGRIQHLTAVYKEDIEMLFVDGLLKNKLALYDSIKLLDAFGSGIISKTAFCFFFFFPLSFLSYLLFFDIFGEAKNLFLLSVFLNLGLLFVVETIYVLLFSYKDFDIVLLSLVVLAGIFSVIFFRICAGSEFFQTARR